MNACSIQRLLADNYKACKMNDKAKKLYLLALEQLNTIDGPTQAIKADCLNSLITIESDPDKKAQYRKMRAELEQ